MKYEVLYRDSFPLVRCDLEQGERIKAESDAMVAMSPTLDVEGKMEGGILSGIARSLLAGEKFFFQEIIAKRGPGYVLFAHAHIEMLAPKVYGISAGLHSSDQGVPGTCWSQQLYRFTI